MSTRPNNPDSPGRVLERPQLPAILRPEEVAHLLNAHPDDVPVLVKKGLLKPLGRIGDRDHSRFASIDLLARVADVKWLDRVTRAIYASRRPPEKRDSTKKDPAAQE